MVMSKIIRWNETSPKPGPPPKDNRFSFFRCGRGENDLALHHILQNPIGFLLTTAPCASMHTLVWLRNGRMVKWMGKQLSLIS